MTNSRRSCLISTSAAARGDGHHRRRARRSGRPPLRRLLRPADDLRREQLDADLPGGDLRPGRLGDGVWRPRRGHRIANDTLYGLGAGVWSRNGNVAYRAGRDIKAGWAWTNCYHHYPAHAAFGGYKQSGIGRGEPQDDARPPPADQEPAGLLQQQPQGSLSALPGF